MKKFIEVMEELKAAREEKRNIEKQVQDIVDMKHEIIKKYGIKNINEMLDRKEVNEKLSALGLQEKRKEIEIKILSNNLEKAVINDIMPMFVEVWNKYKGKRHGEKTSEKIRKELKEKTGFFVSVGCSFEQKIYISDGKEIKSEVYLKKGSKLLEDNVILEVNENSFFVYGGDYVENIEGRVDALLSAYEKAKKKKEEAENACKVFNELTVGNIDNLYISNFRSYIV